MAGTMVHLMVAYQILGKVEVNQVYANYYAGSVAADGIHCRKNYDRSMKMVTHFRQDIPDDDFAKPEMQKVFMQRVNQFLTDADRKTEEKQAMYIGYLVHVLTDSYFVQTIRKEFVESMAKEGKIEKNEAFFDEFTYDVNQLDYRLVKENPQLKEIGKVLELVNEMEVPGYLEKGELQASREWIKKTYFEEEHVVSVPIHISYERICMFIRECVNWIKGQEIYKEYMQEDIF